MKRLSQITQLWRRVPWWSRPGQDIELQALLDGADPEAPQAVRHLWLIRVLGWVRRAEPVQGTRTPMRERNAGEKPAARIWVAR